MAHLFSFAHLLPKRLKPHFHLQRLGRESAIAAVTEPLKTTDRFYAPGVAEKLVDDLLAMRVENLSGTIVDMKGEFVEPVHLQVVCRRLWLKIVSEGIFQIKEEHLKGYTDVNESLTEFYLEAVSSASKQAGIGTAAIRNWFDRNLITPSGTRGIVHREANSTGGMPNTVIDILQRIYIIRPEWRSGSRWYELTHDRLIGPIKESNREWRQKRKNKRLTVSLAIGLPIAVTLIAAFYIFAPAPEPKVIVETQTQSIDQRIISVGQDPIGVAVNPYTNMSYVANSGSNTISVINGSYSIIDEIPVGGNPRGVSVNPITNLIYVANNGSTSVIDGSTNAVVAEIPVGYGTRGADTEGAQSVAVNPNTDLVYVITSGSASGTISVIDGTTNAVTAKISGPPDFLSGVDGMIVNPDSNFIYVYGYGVVQVIDGATNRILYNISVGYASGAAVNPDTDLLYVTEYAEDTTAIIDGKTDEVVSRVSVGDGPIGVAVNPLINAIYVANFNSDILSVLDGNTGTVYLNASQPSGPVGVAVNPNTNTVYITNWAGDELSIVNFANTTRQR